MHKRGEEESAGRVEMSFRGDLWQKDSNKSERKEIQDGSETYDAWFGDDGKKTGGGAERIMISKDSECGDARQKRDEEGHREHS